MKCCNLNDGIDCLYDQNQFVQILGCGPSSFERYIISDIIPACDLRLGRKRKWWKSTIDRVLQGLQAQS